jgi:hypothetical protein
VEAHAREEEQLEGVLVERGALDGNEHLQRYLAVWKELRAPRLLVPMA